MGTHRNWSVSHNPFISSAERSFDLSDTLIRYHNNILLEEKNGDPDIADMYAVFNPLHIDYAGKIASYRATIDGRIAANSLVRGLLKNISGVKIAAWDVAIQAVYSRSTNEYEGILPHFRKPFQSGRYDARITELNSLALKLDGIAALSAVKSDVEAVALQVGNARAAAQGKTQLALKKRDELKEARSTCCNAMFVNVAKLIIKYPEDPDSIDRFFDLSNMRLLKTKPDLMGEEYDVDVPAASVVECGFQINDDMRLLVYNSGGVPLFLYTTNDLEDHNIPAGAFEIEPDDEVEVPVIDLGIAGARFLMIGNKDEDEEGEISFAVL